jgi:hypothetical protein
VRPKKRLNLLFTCAISLVLLVLLTAIFAQGFFNTSNIALPLIVLVYALIFGLLGSGILIVWVFKDFFHFSFNSNLELFIQIMTPIVPWIILGFLIRANQKKWIVFVGLFILMYILCGGLYMVLELMESTGVPTVMR